MGIFELAPVGDLYDMIKETKRLGKIPSSICRAKFIEMVRSLEETHNKGFAHRDIKPENYVFDSEYCLKLTDFGMATPLEGMNGDGFLHERVGTNIYWAP